jgi:hypothetical protein
MDLPLLMLSREHTQALSADTITAEMPIVFLLAGNPASEAVPMEEAAVAAVGTGELTSRAMHFKENQKM